MTQERRKSARRRPKKDIFGRLKSVLPARVVDLSMHGAQVEVSQSLQRRTEVRFSLSTLEEGELHLRAAVRRCSLTGLRDGDAPGGDRVPVYTAGLEFVDVSAEQLEALRRVWARLDSGPPLDSRVSA